MKDKSLALIILIILVVANGSTWVRILQASSDTNSSINFLDVGQGDATLLKLAGGATIMTDAGPGSSVVRSLEHILPYGRHAIDLAIITHPELDHFNGFNHILENNRVGAFVVNGRDRPDSKPWMELLSKIRAKKIPILILGAGDSIHYGLSRIDIISPNRELVGNSDFNEAGIVQKVHTPSFTALLTADIGANVEEYLRTRYDLRADILKIGHHGSKYSSGARFLSSVRPFLAVISSGARNSYGHPSKETLERLRSAGIAGLRTDQLGTITIRRMGDAFQATSER